MKNILLRSGWHSVPFGRLETSDSIGFEFGAASAYCLNVEVDEATLFGIEHNRQKHRFVYILSAASPVAITAGKPWLLKVGELGYFGKRIRSVSLPQRGRYTLMFVEAETSALSAGRPQKISGRRLWIARRLLEKMADHMKRGQPGSSAIQEDLRIILTVIRGTAVDLSPPKPVLRNPPPADLAVYQAMEQLIEHIDERITLTELARTLYLRPPVLSALFKTHLGESFGRLQRSLRMQKACQMLKRGNVSVREVALAIGFENPANFSKAFKEKFGKSPSAFRFGRE